MQLLLMAKRVEKDIPTKDIADYLDITLQQYTLKEKGKLSFTTEEMYKLAEFFEVKIEDIILPRE